MDELINPVDRIDLLEPIKPINNYSDERESEEEQPSQDENSSDKLCRYKKVLTQEHKDELEAIEEIASTSISHEINNVS